MSTRVLVTDHVFADLEAERSMLEPLGCELILAPGVSESELVSAVAGCEAILVCYATITEAIVAAAAEAGCRIISRYGVGYDNIDIDAATRHGILVTYVPDYCLDEVADHTMAMLLALARGVVAADRATARGEWAVPQGQVHSLRGQRLAVIGAGGIGRRVIHRALAFGYDVAAYDPFVDEIDDQVAHLTTFSEAIEDADAITLHVPLTSDNRHLIDRAAIAAMRRAPVLINTSRGPLVDAEAVLEALDDGGLAGVALDVMDDEPPVAEHPLRGHPRAIITPHMAFYSVEAQAELQRRAAQEVALSLKGEAPHRPVNAEAAG
jgi:D-3-phosphoglycerate dehydrogenase